MWTKKDMTVKPSIILIFFKEELWKQKNGFLHTTKKIKTDFK